MEPYTDFSYIISYTFQDNFCFRKTCSNTKYKYSFSESFKISLFTTNFARKADRSLLPYSTLTLKILVVLDF